MEELEDRMRALRTQGWRELLVGCEVYIGLFHACTPKSLGVLYEAGFLKDG